MGAFAWQVQAIDHVDAFWERLRRPFLLAEREGADLLVLPESVVLELSSVFPSLQGPDLIAALAEFEQDFVRHVRHLSQEHRLSVVAGSHFSMNDGAIQNVAFITASEEETTQPKNAMTQFESAEWGVSGASELRLFRVEGHVAATLICYDSEFPEAGRSACEAGALLLVVPAYTETRRGFQRVRWSCQARAVENQVFVVHASLLGGLGREPMPSTYGSSAILCPSVTPFPEAAILAETTLNEEGLAVADLDFAMLRASREQDDVRNWHDRRASTWTVLD